jgi:dicarboxylate/amino acid:cation (Na+ or H+) symporter, DAACS family
MHRGLPARMLKGLLAGLFLGVIAHRILAGQPLLEGFIRYLTEPVGKIFLRLLFMLVIPLIVSALALGVAGLGDIGRLGRIGLKTLLYTVAVSTVAVLIGVAMVNLIRPGAGLAPELRARLGAQASAAPAAAPATGTGVDFLVNLVPANVVKSMADGDMLGVMLFALLLGIGLAMTRVEPARRLEETLEGLYEVVMRLLGMVLQLAPIGVACLLFTLTARLGLDVLRQLGAYVLTVVLALAIHQFVVYPISVAWLGGRSPLAFFRDIRPAMVTAFSTASSNATLPTSLLVAEQNLGLPSHISRFVLTLGSTANQNGTALFEGVTVLFLAQFYGIELSFGQQLTVVAICILGGIGTAGVPAGSIPVVVMILGLVGIPSEGIGMILGVDRFLDMCRTTLNVTGDLAAAVVVARGEPEPTGESTLPAAEAAS